MDYFTERTSCIMCESTNLKTLLEENMTIPIACYSQEIPEKYPVSIPYNIQSCEFCNSIQTKYLGDLNLIYGGNHANLFGSIRNKMNILFAEFILEGHENNSILEIGAGNGDVCDFILEKSPNIKYTIVDPSYWGSKENRIVINSYFEEYNINEEINSIVMSHVFEHFYNPLIILDKIKNQRGIKRVYVNFPDLEYYIDNQNYHVLNPEHIYYVENAFIIDLFRKYGFRLNKRYDYNNFAVFFDFIREDNILITQPKNIKTINSALEYFRKLHNNIIYANKIISDNSDIPVYIWPSSMHTNFVISAGLKSEAILNVLDNSPYKIGKYLYGYNLYCKSFSDIISSKEKKIVLLAGGCYNKEIQNLISAEYNIIVIL